MKKISKVEPVSGARAYRQALDEKKLEDRLNNLYALSDRFPDDLDIDTEIDELEKQLRIK